MQPTTLHLINHRSSTADSFVMEDGREMPRRSMLFALTDEDVKRALLGTLPVTVCPDCLEAVDARRKREEEKQRRIQEARKWDFENDRIARDVTLGAVAGAGDLKTQLVAAKREGRPYGHFVDALVAIEQAYLNRLGRTSMGYDETQDDVLGDLLDELARVLSRGEVAGMSQCEGDRAKELEKIAGLVASMAFEEATQLLVSRIEEERSLWALERGGQA